METALASTMRLLVLVRESLRAADGGEETPIFKAVETHANLCGSLIPDKERMTKAELDKLRANLKR